MTNDNLEEVRIFITNYYDLAPWEATKDDLLEIIYDLLQGIKEDNAT